VISPEASFFATRRLPERGPPSKNKKPVRTEIMDLFQNENSERCATIEAKNLAYFFIKCQEPISEFTATGLGSMLRFFLTFSLKS
jgi:hypothetical protein